MTIRFTCDQCGSVLKIKDELAGTDGKCPKCKKKFVVPPPGEAADEAIDHAPAEVAPTEPPPVAAKAAEPPAKSTKAAASPAKPAKKLAKDEEFDPVSFLMDEGPKKKVARFDPGPDDDEPPARNSAGAGTGPGLSLDDNDDDPVPPPPPKRWGARKEPAARVTDGGTGTGNAARDLLAKSMEESRVRAAEMPEDEPRFQFDWSGFFREFGLKAGGLIAGTVVGVILLYSLVNGMMANKFPLPEFGYVSGKVTYKGKPLPGVTVFLSPVEMEVKGSKKNEKWRTSTGLTDEQGEFTMYYMKDLQGVKVGVCRVSLESTDLTLPIPADYTVRGTKTLEVSKGSNPPYNIELK